MKDILIDNNAETYYAALGISEKRADYILHNIELVVHKIFTPTESGVVKWTDMDILKPMLDLAQTEEERILCAFYVGRKAAELEQLDEIIENEEDYE